MWPELVDTVKFRKGPYYADAGDFATAGVVEIDYVKRLEQGLALVETGRFNYQRAVVADSIERGGGHLFYAGETLHDDGPRDVEQDYLKQNGVLRWSTGDTSSGSMLTFVGYDADWTATDQIAKRAVDPGTIRRFDSLDPTSGGDSSRYSFSADLWGQEAQSRWKLDAGVEALDEFTNGLPLASHAFRVHEGSGRPA